MTGVQCTSVETVFILNHKQQRKGKSPNWTARSITGWKKQISTCALATESDGVRAQSPPADVLLLCLQGGISFCMTPLPAQSLNSDKQRFCFAGYVLEEWRDYAWLPHDLTIRKHHLPTRNDKISGRRTPSETTILHTPALVMSLRVQVKNHKVCCCDFYCGHGRELSTYHRCVEMCGNVHPTWTCLIARFDLIGTLKVKDGYWFQG